jgi:hypothetical protein
MGAVVLIISLLLFLVFFGIGYVIYTLYRACTISNTHILERIFWVVAIVVFMPFVSIIFSLIKEPTWKGKLGPSIIMVATIILMFITASHFAISGWNDLKLQLENFEQNSQTVPAPDLPRQESVEINAI